jgi:hypothetical protein
MAEFQCNARGTLALMPDMMPYDSDGVDVTLIRWMLSLTPEERLDELQAFVDFVNEARAANATEPVRVDLRNAG